MTLKPDSVFRKNLPAEKAIIAFARSAESVQDLYFNKYKYLEKISRFEWVETVEISRKKIKPYQQRLQLHEIEPFKAVATQKASILVCL